MACNSFYNKKTTKLILQISVISQIFSLTCCPLAALKKFMGVLRHQCTVFIISNIPIHYENKY